MNEMTDSKEKRQFILTATQEDIYEYWCTVLAPKYGYKRLIDPKTNKVICKV